MRWGFLLFMTVTNKVADCANVFANSKNDVCCVQISPDRDIGEFYYDLKYHASIKTCFNEQCVDIAFIYLSWLPIYIIF